MNVTVLGLDDVQEIATNEVLKMKADREKQIYSFPIAATIWAYTVTVACTGDNGCSLVLYVSDGGIPDTHSNTTKVREQLMPVPSVCMV